MARVRLPFMVLCGVAAACGWAGGACSADTVSPLDAAAQIAKSDKNLAAILAPSVADGYGSDGEGFASVGLRRARTGTFTDLASALPARANENVVLGPGNVSSFRVTVSPVGARDVRGELHEGRVVYPAVYDDVDEIAVSSASSSELFYLLKSREAPHAFSWNLDLPKGIASVEARADGIWFLDGARNFVLRVPSAYAVDASGTKLKADLAWNNEQRILSVSLPKDDGYAYPLLLDPAFETRIWTELRAPVDLPYPSLAHDNARANSVVFAYDQTWTWDGAVWTPFVVPRGGVAPSQRVAARLVYDEARKNTVLFGGAFGARMFNDTWLWNGVDWAVARPATSPAGRYFQSMTYDRARSQVVLFGGVTSSGALQDTWVWDGSTWTNKSPATKPPARFEAAFAYDNVRGKAVLYGGYGAVGSLSDTWEWNGQDWQKLTPLLSPGPRGGMGMTYDEARKLIVAYGGVGESGISSDTWTFDGTAWKQVSSALSPPPAYEASLTYDPTSKRVQLFGGQLEDRIHNGTWSWDGVVWRQEQNADLPEPSGETTPLYANEAKQELQLFNASNIDFNDPKASPAWAFSGKIWAKRTFRELPVPRRYPALVWDEARQNAILFGGAAEDRLLDDTWTFSGGWVATTPTRKPPARSQHRLVYQPSTKAVVLFGGSNDTGLLNDTWTWDGNTWSLKNVALAPPARVRFSMGVDPVSGNVVLYGGFDDQGMRDDTWTWNGASWKEERPAKAPDPKLGGLILSDTNDCYLLQTKALWRWDGKDWLGLPTVGMPEWDPFKWNAEGAWDPTEKNFVVLGPGTTFRGTPTTTFERVGSDGTVFGGVLSFGGKAMLRLSLDTHDDLSRAEKTFLTHDEKKNEWILVDDYSLFPQESVVSTYDTVRKVGIFVGLDKQQQPHTWTWDGASMRLVPGSPVFSRRRGAALSFDAQRQQAILFGGNVDGNAPSSDTFVFDGNDWVELSPSRRPSPRDRPAMTYDPVRKNIVLFGGVGSGGYLGDTWTWDGTDWAELKPPIVPPARDRAALVFNPDTGTILLFGGGNETGSLGDTWSWNGSTWSQVVTKTPPTPRVNHGFAHLASAKRSILFGGNSLTPTPVRFPWAFYSRGGACSSASDCATGSCVDGVCCEAASCGTCQTCAGTDPGKCTVVTNAEDPDTCAAANRVSCNEKGVCGPSLGGGCKAGADCGSGLCIDGVCCDTACDKPCESCRASEKVSGRDEGRCGAAIAGTNPGGKCADKATCSATGVCSQNTGTSCRDGRYFDNVAGGSKDCAPYRCIGQCLTRCSSANDCVFPSTCGPDGSCSAPPSSAVDDGGGCSMHGTSDAPSGWAFLLGLCAVGMRRRARA